MINPKISIVIIYGSCENTINEFVVSLKNQTFKDYEAVFVNCCSDEKTIDTLSKNLENSENMSMLTLPYNDDIDFAKNSGLDVSSGDYICFIEATENLTSDFVANIYYSNLKQNSNRVKTIKNRLYKRSFIENNTDISEIINTKAEKENEKIYSLLNKKEQNIKNELENYYKNTDNIINNKVYDLNTRCASLEKLIYEKEYTFDKKLNEFYENIKNETVQNSANVLNDKVTQIYNYIDEKIVQKNNEISRIYEILENNYQNVNNSIEEVKRENYGEISFINEKITEIYREMDIRYGNLQKLIELMRTEINNKIESIAVVSGSDLEKIEKMANLIAIEENMNKNFEKLYSYINDNNVKFYKELTDFYKEINEKIKK